MTQLLDRTAAGLLQEYLKIFRVVVVNGPRQSGKSTLLQLSASTQSENRPLISLDDARILRAARTDPTGFVETLARPTYIDEIQRGGEPLLLAIKAAVDRSPNRGQFVLSGSSKFLGVPTLSESLAGRAGIVDLWPLSQAEHDQVDANLIDNLFSDDGPRSVEPPQCTRTELMERVVRGGFPEVRTLQTSQRAAWFSAYVRTLLERELAPFYKARLTVDLQRIVRGLAQGTAQEYNAAVFARNFALPAGAQNSLMHLLEVIYVHILLPGWSSGVAGRSRKRPKVHLLDSGLAAQLRRQTVDNLVGSLNPDAGPLVESFVVSEFLRLIPSSKIQPFASHYRDADQREVDLILEAPDGRVVAIEVKTARDVAAEDFRWLTYLRDRLGERFHHGIVLHIGDFPLPFGDRLTALPISALWAPAG